MQRVHRQTGWDNAGADIVRNVIAERQAQAVEGVSVNGEPVRRLVQPVILPEDKTKDLQLKAAIDLLNGVKVVSNVKPKEEKPKDGEKPDTTAN